MNPNLPIPIRAVGDGWLVAEKPAGISVHNDPGRDLRSLLAAQVSRDRSLHRRIGGVPEKGFHAVGRLDKAADGLILVAWQAEVFARLSDQYIRHEPRKSYLALLSGRFPPSLPAGTEMTWARPLSKAAGGRRNPAGRPPRVPCTTEVKILSATSTLTLVRCRPRTGRKHQIRRHAALCGHPLAGDRRYGAPKAADRLVRSHGFRRIGLHACTLRFRPPESDSPITVESGGMPEAFARLLDSAMTI